MRSLPPVLLLCSLVATGCIDFAAPPDVADAPDVIVIPRMAERPVLDMELGEAEWRDAYVLKGEFVIANGTVVDGTYPFRVRLGADDDALHLAVELLNFPPNPWSEEVVPKYADDVYLFFIRGHEGPLERPAHMVGMWHMEGRGSGPQPGYWNGHQWAALSDHPNGSFNGGRPFGTTWARANITENRTSFWEVYIPREPHEPPPDTLTFSPREAFRMGFLFYRGAPFDHEYSQSGTNGELMAPHDVWPGEGHTPDNHYDPTTWIKLRLP